MSHDTGMAVTLIGDRASPGGRHIDGTVQSEELQAPMMRRARTYVASVPDSPGCEVRSSDPYGYRKECDV